MLLDWFTVLAQIVNFLILLYLLKRFLYGPILRAMEQREKRIADAMAQAEKAEGEAERLSLELAKEKQDLIEEKDALLVEAKNEIEIWRDKTLKEAGQEIEKLRREWFDRLSHDRQAFLKKLKARVAKQVLQIGRKVFEDLANEGLDRRVIEVFMARLSEGDKSAPFKVFNGPLRVHSGFKMNQELSEHLRRNLARLFPQTTSMTFDLDKDLGAGIELIAGDMKVEWNLSQYMEGLEKEIMADLSAMGQGTT